MSSLTPVSSTPQMDAAKDIRTVSHWLSETVQDAEDFLTKSNPGDARYSMTDNGGVSPATRDWLNALEKRMETPEQIKVFQAFEKNVESLSQSRADLMQHAKDQRMHSMNIELSVKAVNKVMAGIQQLLASQ